MQFVFLRSTAPVFTIPTIFLIEDRWDDFSYRTQFGVFYYDGIGKQFPLGLTKIGFKGQTTSIDTHKVIPAIFNALDSTYFSLGQSLEFYRNASALGPDIYMAILQGLRDMVASPKILDEVVDEQVLSASLMRSVSRSAIRGQFARALTGKTPLTDYKFRFHRPAKGRFNEINLDFHVERQMLPSSNIHAIIGRNGIGKTSILNDMIDAITQPDKVLSRFYNLESFPQEISADYFSSLVSVSFSAFDPFVPPKNQPNPAKGTCYFYIGLKDPEVLDRHRTIEQLRFDCASALADCFRDSSKQKRWIRAITKLGSDENFSWMGLEELYALFELTVAELPGVQSDDTAFHGHYYLKIKPFLERMSSGHAIVFLTISKLISTVNEKTLVLLDEPESHLHPPLLSAFMRALSELLHDQNGVAITATHSPVLLQEIPKSCVLKVLRIGGTQSIVKPEIETFGENVGILTSEVFGLEVTKSGFHEVLKSAVEAGGSFESILASFNGQLGFEGRAVLKALLATQGVSRQ